MRAWRGVRVVLVSAIVGLLVGIVFSGDEVVSAEVWIGATAAFVVIAAVADFLLAANVEPTSFRVAWARQSEHQPSFAPLELRNLQALVAASQSNTRVFSRRLRPHLVDIAEHYIPRRIGISFEQSSSEMTMLLGDVGWLIDPAVDERSPTADEIHRFLDVIVGHVPAIPRSGADGAAGP